MKIVEYLFAGVFLLATALICFHLLEQKKQKDREIFFVGEGRSMEPTFLDGDTLKADKEKTPEKNDIIVFECKRCGLKEGENQIMTKRLLAINENNCYWVEGDNSEVSFDSRDPAVNWICPQDINLLGVVIDIEK